MQIIHYKFIILIQKHRIYRSCDLVYILINIMIKCFYDAFYCAIYVLNFQFTIVFTRNVQ